MHQSGYIPIPRTLFQTGFWNENRELSRAEALLDLYEQAAFKPHIRYIGGKMFDLDFGEVPASERYLLQRWNWKSRTKVRKFLSDLEKTGEIKTSKKQGQNVLTISLLATYYQEKTSERQKKDQQETSERPVRDQRETKEEERKNINKEKKESSTAADYQKLIGRIGTDAARMWVQGGMSTLLNGKSEAALGWLQYRAEIGKPLRSHAELVALVKTCKATTAERLASMVEHSVRGQYPALYPDFDQRPGKAGNDGLPNTWYPGIEQDKKLTPQQTIQFHKKIIALGWTKNSHQGKTYFEKPKK